MKVFAKWFYGFEAAKWPVIAFATEAARDKLLREAKAGDLIAFVGTQGPETLKSERGKLLGIAEIGRKAVDTLSIVDRTQLPETHWNEDRGHRWPKAIPMLSAWRFPSKPDIKRILGHQLPQQARIYAVQLTNDEASAILALDREEVTIPGTAERDRQRQQSVALVQGRPTTGPTPTSWVGQVARDANEAAYTYAFRFGTRNLWKIGHAKDLQGRLSEVNKHVPNEILREKWEPIYQQPWPTELDAHKMEQQLLSKLHKYRTSGERVQCSQDILLAAWQNCFGA